MCRRPFTASIPSCMDCIWKSRHEIRLSFNFIQLANFTLAESRSPPSPCVMMNVVLYDISRDERESALLPSHCSLIVSESMIFPTSTCVTTVMAAPQSANIDLIACVAQSWGTLKYGGGGSDTNRLRRAS